MRSALALLHLLSSWAMSAHASPWAQEEGGLYARVAWADETIDSIAADRTDIYAELGLGDGYTVTGKIERVDYAEADRFDTTAWRTTLRRQVFRRSGFVGSVEFGALQGAAIGGRMGCDRLGMEGRVSVGWSGELRNTQSFSFVEVATRQHEACYRNRIEFGLGRKAMDELWLVTQVWLERGDKDALSNKTQTDLVWTGGQVDLTLSYREEFSGAFEERGVVISLSRQY
ncbi:MAG: hypothetical protein AAGJ84_03260 [Pseudomonadota bacterium]